MENQRIPLTAKKGMVATSEPLAAEIGLNTLKKGGNAVDAAIATAIALTVTEPTSNGIGADAFAIVSVGNQKYGISSSGASPVHLDYQTFASSGAVEKYGFKPITTPGAVKLWARLHERFGRLPFAVLFEETIALAEKGFRYAPVIQKNVLNAKTIYRERFKESLFKPFLDTFFNHPDGTVVFKDHANTLREIAKNSDSFYQGHLMAAMVDYFKKEGGYLREEDFKAHDVIWQTPLKVDAFGGTLYELPPNGQGMIALKALQILSHTNDDLHHQIESLKQAFYAGKTHLYGEMSNGEIEAFLHQDNAKNLAAQITESALDLEDPFLEDHGTVYLATADQEMSVSFIQSNYMGYGSGIVVPGTGIALQNRGANFLLKDHPNQYAPGKKPYHTLMPGFIKTPFGEGPMGVMGGFMQPQGHYQVFLHLLLNNLNIQEALDAPRYHYEKNKTIQIEPSFDEQLKASLEAKGHHLDISQNVGLFGRGQIILSHQGLLYGATEHRCDGTLKGY